MLFQNHPFQSILRRFQTRSAPDRRPPPPGPLPRSVQILAAIVLFALISANSAAAQDTERVTDESVEAAISKAIGFIKLEREDDHWEGNNNAGGDRNWAGKSALALLSLLMGRQVHT